MAGWLVTAFMGGMLVGVYLGIIRTVQDINKHPRKWERLIIISQLKDKAYKDEKESA